MNMLNRPPYPGSDLGFWARQMYEYLSAQSPIKGSVQPAAPLLPHITADGATPRAAATGLMLYDPSTGNIVVSKNGAWVPVLDGDYNLDLGLAGDVGGTLSATVLATVNDDAGTHGDASTIPQITIDEKGRITDVLGVAVDIASTAINDATAAGLALLTAADVDAQLAELGVWQEYFGQLSAGYTLANSAAVQKLFNFTANGALTLPTGKYVFECQFHVSGMSASSGNAAFSLEGAATLAAIQFDYFARDLSGSLASWEGTSANTKTTVANMAVAGKGTAMTALVTGTFDVTVAGTIIPSITLATAINTAAVRAGSYFRCRRVADTGDNVVGPWS